MARTEKFKIIEQTLKKSLLSSIDQLNKIDADLLSKIKPETNPSREQVEAVKNEICDCLKSTANQFIEAVKIAADQLHKLNTKKGKKETNIPLTTAAKPSTHQHEELQTKRKADKDKVKRYEITIIYLDFIP